VLFRSDLRKRNPAGDNDARIINDWLAAEFAKITGDSPAEPGRFRDIIQKVRNDAATTVTFRTELAARLGPFARDKLADANLARPAAEESLRTLIDVDDPRMMPGLVNALRHSTQLIRYLGVKGLQEIRDQLTDNDAKEYVAALQQAGTAETNGIIVERIYMALSFPNPDAAVIDAFDAILAARVDRHRQGAVLIDNAEPTALNYLAAARLDNNQTRRLVQRLAVLLRLDVEDVVRGLGGGGFLPDQREGIERRICTVEEYFRQTVRPVQGQGGDICRKLGDNPVLPDALKFELNNWIGTTETAAVLSDNPWNVPRGAP